MSDFDPVVAAREELAMLSDVFRVMRRREQEAEESMSVAESELNVLRKIIGYCRIQVEAVKEKLDKLERER